jgi:hypothetical protein
VVVEYVLLYLSGGENHAIHFNLLRLLALASLGYRGSQPASDPHGRRPTSHNQRADGSSYRHRLERMDYSLRESQALRAHQTN